MMKGSTGGQGGGSYGQQSMSQFKSNPMQAMMGFFMPGYGQNTASGTGSKGSGMFDRFRGQSASQNAGVPPVPEYTNYQQMPVYSSQPAAPSDAITRFMSGYASGGSVEPDVNASLEEDIKAALRLARLIGQMTKKE